MTRNPGVSEEGLIALECVQVGATDADSPDADNDVSWSALGLRSCCDFCLTRCTEYQIFHLIGFACQDTKQKKSPGLPGIFILVDSTSANYFNFSAAVHFVFLIGAFYTFLTLVEYDGFAKAFPCDALRIDAFGGEILVSIPCAG